MILQTELVREETFTFTPDGDEAPIHVRSGRLREWLLANAMHRVTTLIFPQEPLHKLVKMHGLEAPRLKSMTEAEALDPVIVGLCQDGTNVLIDGGHRRWYWAKRNKFDLKGWLLPYELWSQFEFDPSDFHVVTHHADGSMLPQRRGR